MKFIADAMLGRLAKRMRLLGYDVLYDPGLDDNAVIQCSIDQNRIILTRDTALASRPLASGCILVRGDRIDDQIEQLLSALPAVTSAFELTRCSDCNALLEPVESRAVRDEVPEHVSRSHRAFTRCRGCGKVYWKGSHVVRMTGIKSGKDKGRPGRS